MKLRSSVKPQPKLYLASASPRRAQILREAGIRFEPVPTRIDETPWTGENARAMTRRLAVLKARAAAEAIARQGTNAIVIGADTTVELNGRILGKPESADEARAMLRSLSGKAHNVFTSFAAIRLPDHTEELATERTRVRFARVPTRAIEEYVATGESLDKAGGYGIQGVGGRFIERIDGCYFNVVGLPLSRLYRVLLHLGWDPSISDSKR